MTIQHLGRSTAIALVAAALSLAGCKPAASIGAAAATTAPAVGAFTVQAQPDLGPQNQAQPEASWLYKNHGSRVNTGTVVSRNMMLAAQLMGALAGVETGVMRSSLGAATGRRNN